MADPHRNAWYPLVGMTAPIAVGIAEAARMVDVDPSTIRRAIHATEPPYLRAKRIGSKFSIKVTDLIEWHDSLPDA